MREWIEIFSSSPFFALFTSIVNRLGTPTVTFSQFYRKNRSHFSEANWNTGMFLTKTNPSQTKVKLFFFYIKHNIIIEENISEFIRWLEKCSFINCINLAWGRFETRPNVNRDSFVRSVFCSEGSLISTKIVDLLWQWVQWFWVLKELLPSIH